MKYVHPFPARMAPEIILEEIKNLPKKSVVLDPMCGSGMTLSHCSQHGLKSIGCDIDPLAQLISSVASTSIVVDEVWKEYENLMKFIKSTPKNQISLDWIDNDDETSNFINYWFAPKQQKQLRKFAAYFSDSSIDSSDRHIKLLKVALSRLIITSKPKISLARDTAHSRPHKVITENDFDIMAHYEKSVQHVITSLQRIDPKTDAEIHLSCAKNMVSIPDNTIDAIITSPPYLNAIDYLRGHKFSLVWFGYKISELRAIRTDSAGSAKSYNYDDVEFSALLNSIGLKEIDHQTSRLLSRYLVDLSGIISEMKRVLKKNKPAYVVIGNSNIKGNHIQNNKILQFAAKRIGFTVKDEKTREIPDSKRYLPIQVSNNNALASRMRTEHIIQLQG